jgi:hypothetical protein
VALWSPSATSRTTSERSGFAIFIVVLVEFVSILVLPLLLTLVVQWAVEVLLGDLEDDVGTLTGNETGMEIVSFMKESDVSPARRGGTEVTSSSWTYVRLFHEADNLHAGLVPGERSDDDYRMGDVFYVYGAPGFTASEKTFSAFINAMYERSPRP